MTAEQMLEYLKKYGISSKEEFIRRYEKSPGLNIGILTGEQKCHDGKATA